MREWISISLVSYKAYDKRTGGTNLSNVKERFIQPSGKRYPFIPETIKVLSWQQNGTDLMLLVDGAEEDISKFKSQSGRKVVIMPTNKTLTYDLSSFKPQSHSREQALKKLKEDIGLPEGTTLDANMKPVIPEENTK